MAAGSRGPRGLSDRSASVVGSSSFVLMFAVGCMYGMSGLQAALGEFEHIGAVAALLPFGAASLGLALGCGMAGKVVDSFGARVVGIVGTMIWGMSLIAAGAAVISPNIAVITLVLGLGGVGVGLTYLTIVATVGTAFPARPAVGSAIGPLGFAAGTAAAMLVASGWSAGTTALALSHALIIAGGIVVVLAVAFGPGLPAQRNDTHVAADATAASTRRILSLVLFGNAYPGMLLLGIVIPWLTSAPPAPTASDAAMVVALVTVALFLGGLLAPAMRRRVGAGTMFALLLAIRACALAVAVFVPSLPVMLIALSIVLVGHGAGFSVLPGIMRAQDDASRFTRNYAGVLVSWGVSGAIGAVVAALSLAATGVFDAALISAVVVALVTASLIVVRRPVALFGGGR